MPKGENGDHGANKSSAGCRRAREEVLRAYKFIRKKVNYGKNPGRGGVEQVPTVGGGNRGRIG